MTITPGEPQALPALPLSADFDKATDAMNESFGALETVAWPLTSYAEMFYGPALEDALPSPPPDDAYVGALWRFVSDVETRAGELTAMAAELQDLLHKVSAIGRESDYRAELASEADNA